MRYTIRHFEPADLGALAQMGFKFFEAASLPGAFSPTAFADFWSDTIAGGVGVVLMLEGDGEAIGTLGGIIYPDPCTGDSVAQETFWWVDDEHRGGASAALIDAFEQVAVTRGVERVLMSAIHGMRHRALEKFYGGRGYRPLEHGYVKEV